MLTAEIVTALSCALCPSLGNYCPPAAGTTERFMNPVSDCQTSHHAWLTQIHQPVNSCSLEVSWQVIEPCLLCRWKGLRKKGVASWRWCCFACLTVTGHWTGGSPQITLSYFWKYKCVQLGGHIVTSYPPRKKWRFFEIFQMTKGEHIHSLFLGFLSWFFVVGWTFSFGANALQGQY